MPSSSPCVGKVSAEGERLARVSGCSHWVHVKSDLDGAVLQTGRSVSPEVDARERDAIRDSDTHVFCDTSCCLSCESCALCTMCYIGSGVCLGLSLVSFSILFSSLPSVTLCSLICKISIIVMLISL